ncbi:hypothetical protein CRE_30264 [Caenorhabditis remanei]|uniref:Uncharacterized protein n=1 Tax=Caenorhabditis remanei TaxID=31234 RepID=E3NMR7_CAERE|nr:hypothetical protein CRE_30264 [Caenorhabditis remanei]
MNFATAAAKEIGTAILQADAEMKKRIKKMMKQRTLEDVSVLHTVLERVSESSNQQLKIDFEKHRIPERLKKVASLVTNTHYHSFAGTQGDDKEFTLFTCLRNEDYWIEKQRLACAGGAVEGIIYFFGSTLPTLWSHAPGTTCSTVAMPMPMVPPDIPVRMGFLIADMQRHLGETEEDLKFVVDEIESIIDQSKLLMLANIV